MCVCTPAEKPAATDPGPAEMDGSTPMWPSQEPGSLVYKALREGVLLDGQA